MHVGDGRVEDDGVGISTCYDLTVCDGMTVGTGVGVRIAEIDGDAAAE